MSLLETVLKYSKIQGIRYVFTIKYSIQELTTQRQLNTSIGTTRDIKEYNDYFDVYEF